MTGRTLPVAIGLMLAAGCSSPSDPSFGESTDAASPEGDSDQSTDAGPMKPSSDAADVGAPVVDARGDRGADANDAGGDGDASDAAGATDASDVDAGDGRDAQGGGNPESGRLVGITAAHNAVRAAVQTTPPLPPLVWSQTIADYAQQWATSLATSMCAQPQHRSAAELEAKDYGENLATFGSGGLLQAASTAQQAVNAWAAEEACWTYGTIQGTEKCDVTCYTNLHSDGCGHYTQVVWRASTQLGCGVASCKNGALSEDIWICNYAPAGNFIGRAPY